MSEHPARAGGAPPEVFYRHFLDTPLSVCHTDPEGVILDVNASFLRLYGYAREEVLGRTPRILKSGRQDPSIYAALWGAIRNPRVGRWDGEIINRTRAGQEVIVHLSITAIRDMQGALLGFVGSQVDVTRTRQMERELRASYERLREVDELRADLLAVTSHDLKAPLGTIMNHANLAGLALGRTPPDIEKARGHLLSIAEASHGMTEFVGDLLDMRRLEQGAMRLRPSRVRLDTLVQGIADSLSALGANRGVGVRAEIAAREPRPHLVDPVKMGQVLMNLISNAVKYSPPGRDVLVTYEESDAEGVRISVEDAGQGIPEAERERIFDKFYQVGGGDRGAEACRPARWQAPEARNAGIGLSIVKGIVELHGGRVRAGHSRSLGGAVFVIELPAAARPRSEAEMALLVLDPSGYYMRQLKAPLSCKGSALFHAANVGEAMRVMHHERPQLVLVAHGADPGGEVSRAAAATGARLAGLFRDTPAPDREALYDYALSSPIIDLEVSDIIKDVLLRSEAG